MSDFNQQQGWADQYAALQRDKQLQLHREQLRVQEQQHQLLEEQNAIARNRAQAEQQEAHVRAIREQTRAIERQNAIEQDRAQAEQQLLEIEKQRLRADNSDREKRQLQAAQVKELRNQMADTIGSLERLKKLKPAP